MAQLAIKYDNITPYGGIFYAMNDFFHADSADDRWRAARCLVGFRAGKKGLLQMCDNCHTAVEQPTHSSRPTVTQQ